MKVEWVDINLLIPNPKNPNRHSEDQIERLAKLLQYQGFRLPIIVSNQTGLIMAGHGRLLAAQKLGLKEVPVSKQDFITEEQAYAFMVSDNAITQWAELDLASINEMLPEIGPMDIDLLGIKDFDVDLNERSDTKQKECPNCGAKF